ncbi:centromere protein X isoform X3 [Fukomys damarensis]|uniref:centromere protein X isoform X3 n=1 Tax=Fukomys damarensis TaxID=885580 RepID=UPI0008FEB4F2|nr:centromere protein X isoform X3 [Fukomys damarensis]
MGEAGAGLRDLALWFIGWELGAGLPVMSCVHWLELESWSREPAFHAHWLRRRGGATRKANGDSGYGELQRRIPEVSGDALQLMAELLRIFVVEAAIRGVRQAQAEDMALVDVDQLEKVLPQLLLDF